jgi:chromosome segregation ATPase
VWVRESDAAKWLSNLLTFGLGYLTMRATQQRKSKDAERDDKREGFEVTSQMLISRVESLEERDEEKSERLNRLEASNAAKTMQIKMLTQQVDDLTKERDHLKKQLAQVRKQQTREREELLTKIAERDARIGILEDEIDTLKERSEPQEW